MRKVPGTSTGTRVRFGAHAETVAEANESLRAAAKIVKSLGLSLLGKHPGCVKELQIDETKHMKVREFHDAESLARYMTYLDELVARAKELTPEYVPYFTHGIDDFLYGTVNGRLTVTFYRSEGIWYVLGEVTLPSRPAACTVRKKLIAKGLNATVV